MTDRPDGTSPAAPSAASPSVASPSAADRARLAALLGELRGLPGGPLRVDYRDAEALCERLAAKLRAELGDDELAACRWVAIPRGGLIVLGMLSYLLDLSAEQLAPPRAGDRVVVVDDCALTGKRLAETLARNRSESLVVALLYAPPELASSLMAAEPRVRRVLTADELHPLGEPDDPRVAELWRLRLRAGRYGYQPVEPIAFAWSEPDRLFWNDVIERAETGWKLISPEDCLKTRGSLGPPPARSPRPCWRLAAGVAHGVFAADGEGRAERIWLCRADTEEVFALEGVAAALWKRLARHGDPELAADELAEPLGIPPATLRRDVERLATELVSRGLLVPVARPAAPADSMTDEQ